MISKSWILFATIPLLSHADTPLLSTSYTPGAVCLCDGWGLTLRGEGLYWTARENHLTISTANVGLNATSQIPPALDRWNFRGDMIHLTPSWNFGYRAGLGFTSSCDYWDIFFSWTSYKTTAKEEIDLINLPALNIWGYPDTLNAARLFAGKGSWDFDYNLFDIEFGRAFWIGQFLTMRPHFGFRGAWIDQHLNLSFDFQPQNNIPFGVETKLTSDFTGAGLRTGFDLTFTSGSGFGLYGRINLSLLYGTFKSSLSEIETGTILIADSSDNCKMGTSSLQAAIGIDWNECFCCNRYRIGLNIQWELNNWNDLGKFHHYSTALENGIYRQDNTSLSLMGLTLGARLDF